MNKNCEECGVELSFKTSRYLGTRYLCTPCYERLCPPSGNAVPELTNGRALASLGARLGGQIMDGIVCLLLYAVGLGISIVWAMIFGSIIEAAIVVFCFLPPVGYYLMCDALPGGQSIGKRVARTKVIDSSTGAPCSIWQSIGRNVLGILGIFDWVFVFGEFKQRLGDMAAGTIVVRA